MPLQGCQTPFGMREKIQKPKFQAPFLKPFTGIHFANPLPKWRADTNGKGATLRRLLRGGKGEPARMAISS